MTISSQLIVSRADDIGSRRHFQYCSSWLLMLYLGAILFGLRFIYLLSKLPESTLASNGSRGTFCPDQCRTVWDVLILTLNTLFFMRLSALRICLTKLITLFEPYWSFLTWLIWSTWWIFCHYNIDAAFINATWTISTLTSTQTSRISINIKLVFHWWLNVGAFLICSVQGAHLNQIGSCYW